MKIVTMKEYYERVEKFLKKHEVSKVETSSFIDEMWRKTYLCENGATGWEVNRYVYESVVVKGVKCCVKLLETEWFDTDNSESIYMYQRGE